LAFDQQSPDLRSLPNKKLVIAFLIGVAIHILNKNLYLGDYYYWCGESLVHLYWYSYIVALSRLLITQQLWSRILNLICLNWLCFPLADLVDEITGHAEEFQISEYVFFMITALITMIKIYKWRKPDLKIWELKILKWAK